MISITAAVFACQLVICDIASCGNSTSLGEWFELIENVNGRLIDCDHAEIYRIDEPKHKWFINSDAGSYGWNDSLHQMSIYPKRAEKR